MSKIYLLEPSFSEDTVLYEVKLKEVSRIAGATIDEIEAELNWFDVQRLIIDAGYPNIIDRLRLRRLVRRIMRRPKHN